MVCVRSLACASAIALFCLIWLVALPVWGEENHLLEGVQVEGNRFFDADRLLAETGLKPDSPFSLQLLETGIEGMLTLYEDNGFPYCKISPGDFTVSEEGGVCFSFLVEEGPQVRITQVQLEGLRCTKREVILREMGADIFGLYCQSRLDAGLERVRRLSFIEDIEKMKLVAGDDPEEGILVVRLRERRSNSLDGMVGYAPGLGYGRGDLFGSLKLAFDNVFGTGRMMRWSWSRKDRYSSHLEFSYREPWVFGLPPTLELKLRQEDRDSAYLRLSSSVGLLFDSAERLSWGLKGGWEKVVPGPAGERQIPDSRKYMLGATLALDLSDRPDNPREGILYRAEIVLARKSNHPTTNLTFEQEPVSSAQLSLDLEHFLPTLRTHTFSVGVHVRDLITDEKPVPLSDQFELGGPASLRGYREGEFVGTTVAWANLEYRFLMKGNSRLYLFADYGHFGRMARTMRDGVLKRISGEKLGYGMGMRVDSKAGVLGVDYGWGEGGSINQGKVHFRLINRF